MHISRVLPFLLIIPCSGHALCAQSTLLQERTQVQKQIVSRVLPLKADTLPPDSTVDIYLPDIDVVAQRRSYKPLSPEERQKYWKRVRDVKKVLPFARMLTRTMLETYEYLGTFATDKERDRHLERVKKDLVKRYTPVMKTWTLSQGTLLIKLMDRQTGVSGYQVIKSIYGGFTAFSYNLTALFYGGDLKERYLPESNEDDAVTERIIYLVDHGMI